MDCLSSSDHPYLRVYLYLQTTDALYTTKSLAANSSSMLDEKQQEQAANISSSLQEVKELIANISANGSDLASDGKANVSGYSRVDVYEGRDVTFTVVLEAYPPIQKHHWKTPSPLTEDGASVFGKSFSANSYK